MDSGLGSDDDRRGRTKEQKQLRNQQLLSGCFIDAASLSDEGEVDQRRTDERRQGALIFQSSIPQFSMLQMSDLNTNVEHFSNSTATTSGEFTDTATPYNSIVTVDNEEAGCKTPLGFYVDFSKVEDRPKTPPSAEKKNIFSMVIDFEGPKTDKPLKLSSSYGTYKRSKLLKQLNGKKNDSLSGSGSSINSVATGSSKSLKSKVKEFGENESNVSGSSVSLSSTENTEILKVTDSKEDEGAVSNARVFGMEDAGRESYNGERELSECKTVTLERELLSEEKVNNDDKEAPQFVKLSDIECQKTRLDMNLMPRMSRSIPESSWVESPLLMSRSAGYRSAPHPLEPESDEMYDSFTISETSTVSQPRKSVQRLGTDLLRMFLEEIGPDVSVEVEGHKIKAHKCILASRCQYFAALLSGNWLEETGNVIPLQGFSYESVYFSLCHIYSGAAHIPDSISVTELASLADMLGLEGLKEVVEHALRHRYCHNFHKPCAGCCTGVPEVLVLSAAYGLDDLYQKCLQWITQYFTKIWPSRSFSTLPRELREKCYQQHVVYMTPDKVLDTISSCGKILEILPHTRWADSIHQLVTQLIDACHLYHRQHYSGVLMAPSFIAMDSGPSWCIGLVEEQMLNAAKNLGVEQACRSYSRCCKMLDQSWSTIGFGELLFKIKLQLEQCLVGQTENLIRSNAWLRLDSMLRARIKELTPITEPLSRLPRATPRTFKKLNQANQSNNAQSSSDSSRNSSPGVNTQPQRPNSGGSPSLRRSLLLAAKSPQIPPSPAVNRRSTLTQPTKSSSARSVANARTVKTNNASINNKTTPLKSASKTSITSEKEKTPAKRPEIKSVLVKREVTGKGLVRSQSPQKSNITAGSPKKIENRISSPVKTVGRITSPMKSGSRTNIPQNIERIQTRAKEKIKAVNIVKRNIENVQRTSKINKNKTDDVPQRVVKSNSKRVLAKQTKGVCSSENSLLRTDTYLKPNNSNGSNNLPKKFSLDDSYTKTKNVRYSPEGSVSPEPAWNKTGRISNSTSSENSESSVSDVESQFFRKVPLMQRSDTFSKDEPTVIGKLL